MKFTNHALALMCKHSFVDARPVRPQDYPPRGMTPPEVFCGLLLSQLGQYHNCRADSLGYCGRFCQYEGREALPAPR